MDRRAVRLTIKGRVQGVGYRAWAVDAALRLELDGWARNRRDGSVEILAIGSDTSLERLAETCWRGPPAAIVRQVEQEYVLDDGSVGFDVRTTA
jgi:acylphosphatase